MISVSKSLFIYSLKNLTDYIHLDGRRPVYLISLSLFCISSFMLGLVRDVPSLFFWNTVQTFASGGSFTNGAAVIVDMYKLEERGAAMGIYMGVRS